MKNLIKQKNKSKIVLLSIITLLFLLLVPDVAFASGQNIGGLLSTIQGNNFKKILQFFTGSAFMIGVILFIVSIFQFKKYNDEQGRTPLKTPMIYFVLSVCLVGLSTYITIGTNTIFQGKGKSKNTINGFSHY